MCLTCRRIWFWYVYQGKRCHALIIEIHPKLFFFFTSVNANQKKKLQTNTVAYNLQFLYLGLVLVTASMDPSLFVCPSRVIGSRLRAEWWDSFAWNSNDVHQKERFHNCGEKSQHTRNTVASSYFVPSSTNHRCKRGKLVHSF